VKVTQTQLDHILAGHTIFADSPRALQELIRDLAADLVEARTVKKQIIRAAMPVIAANVSQTTRVETSTQLRMHIAEPYATMLEARAKSAAAYWGTDIEPFPLILVPRLGIWILQLHDLRHGPAEPDTVICRGSSLDELQDLLARERAESYGDGVLVKRFKRGGPLEWYAPPKDTEAFVNVLESTDAYIAQAIGVLPEASKL
jgi:hypothetical protein